MSQTQVLGCTNCASEVRLLCAHCVHAEVTQVLDKERLLATKLRILGERERLKSEIARRENLLVGLQQEVDKKEQDIGQMKQNLYKKQAQLDSANKRLQQKPQSIQITNATMTVSTSRVSASLPLLHPFRQLLSVALALNDERRKRLEEIVNLLAIRDEGVDSASLSSHTAQALILVSEFMNVPLPFPVAFGQMTSSMQLAIPEAALSTGTYPFPRLLHPAQKRLVILDGTKTPLALLIEDVIFVAAVFGVSFTSSIDNTTILDALTSAIRAPQFGNIFSQPSMRIAAFESKDNKITDNHEWTVLDSSYVFLCFELRKSRNKTVSSIYSI